ncbi:uncharacterized protein LOC129759191 [Uranotaenia lowii]|uniref:uncharacterized protein LOC129759191 n=1 Tax=Uranotaenia lowii TaxID=190385 RepID=UPI00247B2683|nr:uncharacterized protein LOC129759191 [Uranotaenia lowii]
MLTRLTSNSDPTDLEQVLPMLERNPSSTRDLRVDSEPPLPTQPPKDSMLDPEDYRDQPDSQEVNRTNCQEIMTSAFRILEDSRLLTANQAFPKETPLASHKEPTVFFRLV